MLTVGEPHLIKDIMIKDFDKFVDRGNMSFGDPIFDRSLLLARGEQWKTVRTIVSLRLMLLSIKFSKTALYVE